MKKPKTYEIDSFKKLINVVNNDNDLVTWLMFCDSVIEKSTQKKPNTY